MRRLSTKTTASCAWANRSRRGVTLVELLVTIIVAGFAFAALVPLFVYASQTSAADNARTVALGLAQDKMERIRSLPYDQVVQTNLDDVFDENGLVENSFARQHGLGNTAFATVGTDGKEYIVGYEVKHVYDPALDVSFREPGLELYKLVTVDVYWEGNPLPVKHTRLRTTIYKQYAGPVILSLQVEPRSQDAQTLGMIVPQQGDEQEIVEITAYAMTGVPIREVRFSLASGSYKKDFTQPTGTAGVYVWKWSAVDAPDGFYTITAQAVSTGGFKGNAWRVVEQLESGSVPAPAQLAATPGDRSVTLSWQRPAAGDIAYYEIWRSLSPERDSAALLGIAPRTAEQYPDTAVDNDVHYYYWVYAVDLVGNTNGSGPADATPSLSAGDHTPPTVPILTATAQPAAIALSWTVSVDPVTSEPSTGLSHYEIFRSDDGVDFTFLGSAGSLSLSYSDPVGTDSPAYWYKIRAVDLSVNVNRSDFSAPVGPLQTPATTTTLTVTNDRNAASQPCTVTVQDVMSQRFYDQNGVSYESPPASVSIASKGGSAQWRNLPLDKTYRVTATYATGNPRSSSQSAPPWTLSFQ
jgi:hypothetical protein